MAACTRASSWDAPDLLGSTLTVDPVNVAAGAAATSAVTVTVRRSSTAAVRDGTVQLSAPGCRIGPSDAQALDAAGSARFSLDGCELGATPVTATLVAAELRAPLPSGASVNVYAAADASGAVATGTPLHFQVQAKDASGAPDVGYTGTIHFVSSDPAAILPGDVVLGTAAHGVLLLQNAFILTTPGQQTVSAVDRASGRVLTVMHLSIVRGGAAGDATIDGGAGTPIPDGAVATLSGLPTTMVAGTTGTLRVALSAADGTALTDATGLVLLTASDPRAHMPAAVSFRAGDRGTILLPDVGLRTAGAQTLRASIGGHDGQPLAVQVAPAPAASLLLDAPDVITAGVAFAVGLRSTDVHGNATAWPDALRVTADDVDAALPADLPAGSLGPSGVGSASLRLYALGSRTITVSAAGYPLATATVRVTAGTPAGYAITGPTGLVAGVAGTVTVYSVDAYGNGVPLHTPPLRLASNDAQATLAADASMTFADGGSRTLPVTLRTAGPTQIVSLTTLGGQILAQATIPVDNATAAQVSLVLPTPPINLGVALGVQATVRDAFGNLARIGAPVLSLLSSDLGATLPAPTALTPADAGAITVPLTFSRAGTLAVSARLDGVTVIGSTVSAVVNRIDEVSLGGTQICVRLHDGTVYCWGKNLYGDLGSGSVLPTGVSADDPGPAPAAAVLPTGRTPIQIAAGGYSTCVLLDNGLPTCWGFNDAGPGYFGLSGGGFLGFGDTAPRGHSAATMGDALPAIDLGTGVTAAAIARGFATGCALLPSGAVKCWGDNAVGTCGLGDTLTRGSSPTQMGDALPTVDLGTARTARHVAVNGAYKGTACALLDDGTLKCWGANNVGQLGQGDTTNRGGSAGQMGDALPAVDLGTGRTARAIVGGLSATMCALLDDGSVKCWGQGATGAAGQGDTATRGTAPGQMGDALPPLRLGTGRTAVEIGAGDSHVCALLDQGSVKCWGDNTYGQLGLGDTVARGLTAASMGDALPAVALPAGEVAVHVIAGGNQTCVLFASGRLGCWGASYDLFSGQNTPPVGDSANEMGNGLAPIVLW